MGHGIAAVETRQERVADGKLLIPSIGRRHRCRGNDLAGDEALGDVLASIGPRHRCRGNFKDVAAFADVQVTLQLGHGIAAVETTSQGPRPVPPTTCFNWATASLPWKRAGRGDSDNPRQSLQLGHGIAAVETGGRGNGLRHTSSLLQLGHGIAAVETPRGSPGWSDRYLLQLGHGIAAVETSSRPRRLRTPRPCFNWATASLPWKPFIGRPSVWGNP